MVDLLFVRLSLLPPCGFLLAEVALTSFMGLAEASSPDGNSRAGLSPCSESSRSLISRSAVGELVLPKLGVVHDDLGCLMRPERGRNGCLML